MPLEPGGAVFDGPRIVEAGLDEHAPGADGFRILRDERPLLPQGGTGAAEYEDE